MCWKTGALAKRPETVSGLFDQDWASELTASLAYTKCIFMIVHVHVDDPGDLFRGWGPEVDLPPLK